MRQSRYNLRGIPDYAAINRIPQGIAVASRFLGPLGVALITWRKVSDVVWVLTAVLGVILISLIANTSLDIVGLLFALLSGAAWAIFMVLSGPVARIFPSNAGLTLSMTIAALVAPQVYGILPSLESVAAALVGFVILHEALEAQELFGIRLVTVAAIATTRATDFKLTAGIAPRGGQSVESGKAAHHKSERVGIVFFLTGLYLF